jgi:hypothetical protein
MGWSRGADIFDPTMQILVDTLSQPSYGQVVSAPVVEEVAYTLLDKLTGEADWDDVDDSLEQFQEVPAIVRAFNRLGWLAPNQYGEDGLSNIELPCSRCKKPVRVNESGEAVKHEPAEGAFPGLVGVCFGSGLQYHWGY